MINRDNYRDILAYIDYLERVEQNGPVTIQKRWGQYRHLLNWADSTPLPEAKEIDLTFPAYLNTARADGKGRPLAAGTIISACNAVKMFFNWARSEYPKRYRHISPSWINTIRPARERGQATEIRTHAFYSYEDMVKIAGYQPVTLRERRDRAAMIFLFLSAMRAGAFISLPIDCFDPGRLTVDQIPARGVRTKNHKAAITTLLNIPGLIEIVYDWDRFVRLNSRPGGLWYAHISRSGELLTDATACEKSRQINLRNGMKIICSGAGTGYLSPHKLRHGHVVFALKRVKDLAGLKAISQNVMHSNVSITDGLYGQFTHDDVHDLISGIRVDQTPEQPEQMPLTALNNLVKAIGDNPQLLALLSSLQQHD